jgi:carbonic anhydrase
VGVLIAMMAVIFRLSRTAMHIRQSPTIGPAVVSLNGPITFMSAEHLTALRKKVMRKDLSRGLVLDFSGVSFMDSSGAALVLKYLKQLLENNIEFTLKDPSPEIVEVMRPLDEDNLLQAHLSFNNSELKRFFTDPKVYSMVKLVDGAHKFKQASKQDQEKFTELAKSQSPHTLLIACADSRLNTNLITNTDLGEIFTLRNVGNIIPCHGSDSLPAEGAGVEYAVGVLGVNHIIVCGHSNCGAITAIMQDNPALKKYSSLANWLQTAEEIKTKLPLDATIEQAIKFNIVQQLENLKTYPLVKEKMLSGDLQLHGWYYNIMTGASTEWDVSQQKFVKVGSNIMRQLQEDQLPNSQKPINQDI